MIVCCQREQTALMLAAGEANVDVVQLLLNHGANVNDREAVCVIFLP